MVEKLAARVDTVRMIWVDVALVIGIISMVVPIDLWSMNLTRFRVIFDWVVVVFAVLLLAHFVLRLLLHWQRQPWPYLGVFTLSVIAVFDYAASVQSHWLTGVLGGGSLVVAVLSFVCWRVVAAKVGHEWRTTCASSTQLSYTR